MVLELLPSLYAVCRLEIHEEVATSALQSEFFSITKTKDEISVVCREDVAPSNSRQEKSWKVFRVQGSLDFSLTGVISSIATPLAVAGISIFALSTYGTDYFLIKEANLKEAIAVLELSGFTLDI